MGKDFPCCTEQGDSSVVVTVNLISFILVKGLEAPNPLPSTGREAFKDVSSERASNI